MTGLLLLGYLAVTAAFLLLGIARFQPRQVTMTALIALPAWLVYVGLLSASGVLRNTALRPPGVVYLFVPVFAFVFFYAIRSNAAATVARAVPLWILLGFQVYRVGVELFLHRLWINGIAPRMLTYRGANADILIGVSAPLIAWVSTKGRFGLQLALAWNWLGLLSLANVVTRAALTAPGPFHAIDTEVPNLLIGAFPFTYIAGFFAPLAVVLHVLAIRSIRSELKGISKRKAYPS